MSTEGSGLPFHSYKWLRRLDVARKLFTILSPPSHKSLIKAFARHLSSEREGREGRESMKHPRSIKLE